MTKELSHSQGHDRKPGHDHNVKDKAALNEEFIDTKRKDPFRKNKNHLIRNFPEFHGNCGIDWMYVCSSNLSRVDRPQVGMTLRMKNIILPGGLLNLMVLIIVATLVSWTPPVGAKEIGKVDTRFRFLTPDDTVRIEVFDDPDVVGVACYLSRAKTGGVKGAIGVAEDTSDASLDCRQVGSIEFKSALKDGEKVFSERRSLIFKELQVVRYCDTDRNTLVYLAFSDRVVEGSPKNSVSAVPIAAYAGQASVAKCVDYLK